MTDPAPTEERCPRSGTTPTADEFGRGRPYVTCSTCGASHVPIHVRRLDWESAIDCYLADHLAPPSPGEPDPPQTDVICAHRDPGLCVYDECEGAGKCLGNPLPPGEPNPGDERPSGLSVAVTDEHGEVQTMHVCDDWFVLTHGNHYVANEVRHKNGTVVLTIKRGGVNGGAPDA